MNSNKKLHPLTMHIKQIRLTLLITLLFTFSSIYAQEKFKLGVELGPSFQSIDIDGTDGLITFFVGVTGEYKFSNLVSLKSGLNLETKGASIPAGFNVVDVEYDYLLVPLLLKFSSSGELSFFGNIGPGFNFLLDGGMSIIDDFDLTAIVGAGAQYAFAKNHISIEGRYSKSLSESGDLGVGVPAGFKTEGFYLLVGYARSF